MLVKEYYSQFEKIPDESPIPCGCGAKKKHITPLTFECNRTGKEEKEMPKYAIIRPDSQSGHSPSERFKTEKQAILVAKKMAQDRAPAIFEVVRILKRVSTVPSVKITIVG